MTYCDLESFIEIYIHYTIGLSTYNIFQFECVYINLPLNLPMSGHPMQTIRHRQPPGAMDRTSIFAEIGNDKFKAKDYLAAIEYYTFALGSIMEARGALPDLLSKEGEVSAERASESLDELCASAQ